MAEKKEQEMKIPVFTVLKNGAILKNIFIVNTPPSPTSISQDYEETLVVGRHPDCNITLTHPSISRFHLQFHSNPSIQHLSLIDLSSVHGTWVSDKKVEPGVRVELKEGDTVRVGGSSRVYRLHWIPLSCAYDSENPFVPPAFEDKEDENAEDIYQDVKSLSIEEIDSLVVEGKEENEYQDENSLSVENRKNESQELSLVELESLCFDEKLKLIAKKEVPSAPPLPENMVFDEMEGNESSSRIDHELKEIFGLWSGPLEPRAELVNLSFPVGGEVISENENQQLEKESMSSKPHSVMEVLSERDAPESSLISSEQEFELSENRGSPIYVHNEDEMHSVAEVPKETENISLGKDHSYWSGPLMMENLSLPVEGIPVVTNNQQVNEENQTPQSILALQSPSNGGVEENGTTEQEMNLLLSLEYASSDEEGNPEAELLEETKNHSVSRKRHEVMEISGLYSVPIAIESADSSLFAGEILVTVLSECTENKESQSPQSVVNATGLSEVKISESAPLQSEEKLNSRSIWSRRGKAASVPLIRTGESRSEIIIAGIDAEVGTHNRENTENNSISKALFTGLDEEEIFTPNKENFTPNTLVVKSLNKNSRVEEIKHSKALFTGSDEEEEIFTPDKENFSPNTLLVKSLKKKVMVEETKQSKSCRSSSSKVTFSPGIHPEDDMTASLDKQNHTPKVLQERKSARLTSRNRVRLEQGIKRRSDRVPFQSLLGKSPGKSRSEASVPDTAMGSCNSVTSTQTMVKKNNSNGEAGRNWNMVVDTATLLNKESRKTLHLLQGLKGTHLIIPRMVLRELDCLKRRGSLFRRRTEASLVLEWIEECMVKTKCWIHVQNSIEEARAIAPTPPATPQSCFSQGTMGFSSGKPSSMPFSSHWNLTEIVSPTEDDHILDCALLYRKMKNDGRLVLLSDDVTLKIKAMAEGLICETAQEFRESLVNPFSDRFLWADSSPRGLTWSYKDDIVLREQYYRCPLKKSAKGESAKGLKLILHHNSHYGQIYSVR
nr:FHA domain-containing protein PS1 isoform X2 [Quercus suber]